jgi:hypothetical protein
MDIGEIRDHGHHLAITATLRMLAFRVAELGHPDHADRWFTKLGQQTFGYVDETKHQNFDEPTIRAVKEAAYDTLRMIFDPKGI